MPSLKLKLIFCLLLVVIVPSGCSHYKSSWDCKNPHGLGCTSIAYADEIARKHIILNEDGSTGEKTVLINEHYSDFKKYETQEVVIK